MTLGLEESRRPSENGSPSANERLKDALRCVDQGLDSFGINVKESVYRELIFQQCIPLDQLFANSEAFVLALRRSFGDEGYSLVERAIVAEMKKTFFNLSIMGGSYSIPNAFELVRPIFYPDTN